MIRRDGLLVGLLLLVGCGGGGNQDPCPTGFEQSGAACVPVFDDCAGPAEIPVLGGGCEAVGVTACATGLFVSDGEGGCEPLLPAGPDPCPVGTMEVLGQTTCQPVGVTACAAGFVTDGAGGCDAVLPAGPDPCPPGTIALLGHDTCQSLGDCGSGTWGNVVDDSTTVYVDQTADATGADGTALAPFVTLDEALAVVLPGGQIAVAAGDYSARLIITQPVRLTGRCAELVTIRGRHWLGSPQPPVTLQAAATGTTVRGVTLTGPDVGLMVQGAQQVVVEQVQVRDASSVGIFVWHEAEVSLQQVVVAGCADHGIFVDGSTLDMERSVVRDTLSEPDNGWYGNGIGVNCESFGACGSLRVSSSLVSGNRYTGISVFGMDAEVTASVVRDTLPEQGPQDSGRGISVHCSESGLCGSLEVSSCLVSGNRDAGIFVGGVDAEITDTVVRDTQPEQSSQQYGAGIVAQPDPTAGAPGTLRVDACLVSGNRGAGVEVLGMHVEVTGTEVRDTLPQQLTGRFGRGIGAQCRTEGLCGSLLVSSSLVSNNREIGILSMGVDTEVAGTVVRDTLPEESTELGGRGINAQCFSAGVCASLRVSASVVSGSRDGGILVFGGDAEITATLVRNTVSEQLTGFGGVGIGAQCDDAGGDCGSMLVSTSVVSSSQGSGIAGLGVDTEIRGTTVRDTSAEEGPGIYGRGITIDCAPWAGVCGSAQITSSLVQRSENAGIFISGAPASLEGVAVIDTRSNGPGPWTGQYGQGVWAVCDERVEQCGNLSMTSCLVDSSQGAGVAVEGVSGFIASSTVRAVTPQPLDEKYGYGVQIGRAEQLPGLGMPVFNVNDCVIGGVVLAGILYYGARGTLSGSLVTGGENSVIMNEGSEPTILENNTLSGTVTSEPTWANLFPSPSPPPALPLQQTE